MNDEIYKILKKYKAPDELKGTIDEVLSGKYKFNESNELITANYKVPEMIVGEGKGKYELYDKAIPSFMKKYGKKWNAKVYDDVIEAGDANTMTSSGDLGITDIPVTIIKLTPEMKKAVQGTPQPLFEIFGGVGLATWGSKAVSDNIENNIISQKTN